LVASRQVEQGWADGLELFGPEAAKRAGTAAKESLFNATSPAKLMILPLE
jgi:hypothetical protein